MPGELQLALSRLLLRLTAVVPPPLPVPAERAVLPGRSALPQHQSPPRHISCVHSGYQIALLLLGGLSEPQTWMIRTLNITSGLNADQHQ